MKSEHTRPKASNANRNLPVREHWLFPVVVALWCAAVIGFGSLIIPVSRLEALLSATGLSSIIPAAAAPLGATARALIAIVGALAGATFGALFAVQIARGSRAAKDVPMRKTGIKPAREEVVHPAKRPIKALEELGTKTLDDAGADDVEAQEDVTVENRRRRQIGVRAEQGQDGSYEDRYFPGMRDVSEWSEPAEAAVPADEEPLHLVSDASESADHTPYEAVSEAEDAEDDRWAPAGFGMADADEDDEEIGDTPPLSPGLFADEAREFGPPPAPDFGEPTEPEISEATEELDSESVVEGDPGQAVEPLGFAAPSLPDNDHDEFGAEDGQRPDAEAASDEADAAEEPLDLIEPSTIDAADDFAPHAADGEAGEPASAAKPDQAPLAAIVQAIPLDTRPLSELGTPALVERLARSLQRRRMMQAAAAEKSVTVEDELQAEEIAPVPVEESVDEVVDHEFDVADDDAVETADGRADHEFEEGDVFELAPELEASDEDLDEPLEQQAVAEAEAPAQPPVPVVPEILRPLDLEMDQEEGEEEDVYGLSLPRFHNGAQSADPAGFGRPEAANGHASLSGEMDDEEDDGTFANPFQQVAGFVRVEEEEPEEDSVESAVVFPGQESEADEAATPFGPPADAPFSGPAPTPAAAEPEPQNGAPNPSANNGTRPFDGPASAVPFARPGQKKDTDPAETERALRSALATLQRIGGTG